MRLSDGFQLLATAPDGIAHLRELILSLAVTGKLVPQDPADEAASELLRRIQQERDQRIINGKIKREKLRPGITDEEKPYDLPNTWEWVRFNDLLPEFQNGASSRGDKDGIPTTVLRLADIKNGHICLNDTREIPIAASDVNKYELAPGDILAIRVNGSADLVGRLILNDRKLRAIYCDHFIRIRVNGMWVSPAYLATIGGSKLVRNAVSSLFITTAGQKTVNQGHIGSLIIPLPPLDEQRRIVAKFDELMCLCDELETRGRLGAERHAQLTTTLFDALAASGSSRELAENWARVAAHFDLLLDRPEAVDVLEQTILLLALRGLLLPQDVTDDSVDSLLEQVRTRREELVAEGKAKRQKPITAIETRETPFALPAGWQWIRLGELLSKLGAGSTPLGGKDVYVASGVKFLRSQNIWNEGLRLEGVAFITPETHARMAGTVVLANDILFNITGASIGRCAAVPGEFDEANVSQHVAIVRPLISEITPYLHLVLISPYVQQAVMDVQVGVSREGLSMSKLGQFVIPLPPLAEQSRIVARVAELRHLCGRLRKNLIARQTCQARFAETMVEQAASAVPLSATRFKFGSSSILAASACFAETAVTIEPIGAEAMR